MTGKLLCAVAAAGLLAACEARFGNDAGEVADNATAAGRAEEGRLTVEADGFNMSIDIPDFVESEARIDDDNNLIYPGSDFAGMHVQGGRERPDGERAGEVELRFTHADPPDQVAAWYRDPARAADLTVDSATRRGDAIVIAGTVKSDNERFTATISPRAGGGSDTRLVLADAR
jgi:hypothetical protein